MMEIRNLLDDGKWERLVDSAAPFQDQRNDRGHAEIVTLAASDLYNSLTGNSEEIDKEIVLIAAFLHDVGWSRLDSEQRVRLFDSRLTGEEERGLRLLHEEKGVELASALMREAGYSYKRIEEVARLIDGHDTRRDFISREDGIVRDADKLWMISDEGFAADLKRRNISRIKWASTLRERFLKPETFYYSESRNMALSRLEVLENESGAAVAEAKRKPVVLICHYRVGWTDGVSLEIEKRKNILEEMGYDVHLLAGPGSSGADFTIEELDFDTDEARKISRNAFGSLEDFQKEEQLEEAVFALSEKIYQKLCRLMEELSPDFILLHNIFSHGRHIAAAHAFFRCMKKYHRPALATHHDFYWERDDFRKPSCSFVYDFLKKYVPPVIPGMRHATINSLAARSLLNRYGIDAMIFPDTLDFTVPQWKKDEYNRGLLSDFHLNENDIYILQATRIVRRKGIELIPPLIKKLNSTEYLGKLMGKTLYNGKKVTPDSRFVFLLAGYAEQEAEPYRRDIQEMMDRDDIPYCFLRSRIAHERDDKGDERIYSLFDTYPYADLVSYPSLYEGWGNQFIEAVFARKPVLVHEYPVFLSDIKIKGYSIISLGGDASQGRNGLFELKEEVLLQACDEIIEWLLSSQTEEKLNDNFDLARNNNSYDYLRSLMKRSMEHYEGY